ncbi:MAG: DNA cytosine methyltransferase [Microcoleus sp.]
MNIISLFAGCGGLDLGFRLAGFNPVWANEYDKSIWDTYQFNHTNTLLDRRDIRQINSEEVPDCVGIIGGPPCQSWSAAGAKRGIDDCRGQLFWDYIRIVRDKQPLFFLAENVSGILAPRNRDAFTYILSEFEEIGYRVSFKLLNARSFGVPQDRQRVIVVGYREILGFGFEFPAPGNEVLTLRDAIGDLESIAPMAVQGKLDKYHSLIANHECADLGFSSIYMSRNRVRSWSEPSFTIQASGRHAPIHPQANKMILIAKDKRIFDPTSPQPYRRLSVRECARVQTFPDDFIFKYKQIADGYKMVGNAVPVNFARVLASKIFEDIGIFHKVSGMVEQKYDNQSWMQKTAFLT